MGCDIHLYTEKLQSVNNKQKWVNNDLWKINPYYSPENTDGERYLDLKQVWNGRDYNLFSILADVRNYDDNPCISQPRGIPSDASKEFIEASDNYGIDGHSHSYFTLAELIEYANNNRQIQYKGFVSKENELLIARGEMPNSWCKGASPELGYVYKEWMGPNTSLDKLIEAVKLQVKETYWDVLPEHFDKFRIVFFFDN